MTTVATAPSGAYAGFETLEELQAESLMLLRQWKKSRKDGQLDSSHAGDFLPRVAATGARLASEHEREVAQAALDFWETELIAAGAAPADLAAPALAPFDPAALPPLAAESPFVGLKPYAEAQASSFFGREEAAARLADQVEARAAVIVSGPSGSGKSSLIAAGLLPTLRARGALGDAGRWDLVRLPSPGPDPLSALIDAIHEDDVDDARHRELVERLRASASAFPEIVAQARTKPALVIADQFEEIFTLNSSLEDQNAFAEALAALKPPHHLVIAIREDFLSRLQKMPALAPFASDPENGYSPPPLTPIELDRIIRAPADRAGLRFADGVIDRLVKAVAGEPAGLPLLQFTLERLWREARATNWVSHKVADDVGSPRVALKRSADAVYDGLNLIQNQENAKEIFLNLVVPGAENEFVRQPRLRSELHRISNPQQVDLVLQRFVDAGLIRQTSGRSRADDRFDVAHEALIRNWPLLNDWLVANRDQNRAYFQLREGAILWKSSGQLAGHLLSGLALEEARPFRGKSVTLDAFLEASDAAEQQADRELKERARREDERNRRDWRNRLVYLPLLALVLIGGVVVSLLQRDANNKLETQRLLLDNENKTLLLQRQRFESEKTRVELEARHAAEIAQLSSRQRAQISLRDSLAASRAGDVGPLKRELQNLGVPQEVLDNLSFQRMPSLRDSDTEVVRDQVPLSRTRSLFPTEPPPAPSDPPRTPVIASAAPPSFAPARPVAPTCQGVLWLGSRDDPKVDPFPEIEAVTPGQRFTLRTGIRLRKELPAAGSYQLGPAIGAVQAGATVVSRGPATGYDRSGRRQLWLPVDAPRQFCTSVFIQYVGDNERLKALREKLAEVGVVLPPAEEVETAKGRAEVRYFYAQDRQVAEQLAGELASFNGNRRLRPVPLLGFPTKPAEATIEVWIDLST